MGGDARERVDHGGPGAAPKIDAHVAQIALASLAPGRIRTSDPQICSLRVRRYDTGGAPFRNLGNLLMAGLCARLSRRLYDY